jgi:TM2 domain-containing membrane protein YozV
MQRVFFSMKFLVCLGLLLFCCSIQVGYAQKRLQKVAMQALMDQDEQGVWVFSHELDNVIGADSLEHKENARLVAIALNVTLGMLGVHRMYLGTDVKVPIFYTLTFGGGGVLWLVDLGFLIATKDIQPFLNNKHLFMFSRK